MTIGFKFYFLQEEKSELCLPLRKLFIVKGNRCSGSGHWVMRVCSHNGDGVFCASLNLQVEHFKI